MLTLITGSSRGIGNAIAKMLLANNYSVIGTSTKVDNPFPNSTNYSHIKCDLANENEIVSHLKPVFERGEVPEILINNAGIFMEAQMEDSDSDWLAKWDRTQQVNLRSSALLAKWAINAWMKNRIEGRLINITSRAGQRGDTGEYAAYAASKAGMTGLTKSIARSFGAHGITAYSIAPGFVETDMARESIEVYGADYLVKDLALDSIAPPEQIAEMALLLASGKLKHATGQTFHINSGSYLV